ncbi:MAG: MarR family transcriptional regulator [Nitrososphaeraceae archaeon]|nr:MarR family transcriptional regulator [Nitrososphaeraceae archaeon]
MGGGKKRPVGSNAKNKDSTTASSSNQAQSQTQKKEDSKKSSGGRQKLSVAIEETAGRKALQNMKAITVQALARNLGVKISVANSFIRTMETRGSVKLAGGYSGHRIYQLVQ